jgi:hypothetical protein
MPRKALKYWLSPTPKQEQHSLFVLCRTSQQCSSSRRSLPALAVGYFTEENKRMQSISY